MKTTSATTIIEELDLPEDRRAALSREALRQGIPVDRLVQQILLKKADQIIRASAPTHRAA